VKSTHLFWCEGKGKAEKCEVGDLLRSGKGEDRQEKGVICRSKLKSNYHQLQGQKRGKGRKNEEGEAVA